ncbi:MAG: DUF6152 family protein [Chloroflexi bacterium]|nr:DUF6152 family protein [Chloroflexota bacterium]
MKRLHAAAVLVATLGAVSISAHHGSGISYDLNAPLMTIEGSVSELAWRNPHVSVFIDVTDDKGTVVNWGLEHNNVATLARQGYNRNSLRVGEPVTAVFHPSRSGAPIGLIVEIVLADGKEILQRQQAGAPRNPS